MDPPPPSEQPAAAALGTAAAAGLGATLAVQGAGAAGLGMAAAARLGAATAASLAAAVSAGLRTSALDDLATTLAAADLAAAHRAAAATSVGHHQLAAAHRAAAATSIGHHQPCHCREPCSPCPMTHLPSSSAADTPTTASARATGLVPSGFGLPGYPTCVDALTGLPSPTRLPRHPPPGFSTTRPLVADATWASPPPSTDPTLASTIATIQATLATSQERERAASGALEQERALAATLTAQMATAQHLVIGPPPVDQATTPPTQRLPTPLDSMLTTSSLSTPRRPDYRTFGPSCPSFWTWRPPTILAGGGRSFSPCGATPSTTTSSTTSPPCRPELGP
ncbi:receptor kinase-like protein Xa21 isoform X1 [Zea mays]|jgi:hypothetical protein|uniref:receptor kinase-like protein Xa21 isoform X1 n=1 Tax=Zea mays TaxID=4577 RepID=UPI0004DE7B3B|nr:receptor kinase-like protein Xa21 isoform X1 [Zea mays]|eukprot:XP_008670930.1 receptor kinase-like protein Xa21 isoform X1 [Zea mays]